MSKSKSGNVLGGRQDVNKILNDEQKARLVECEKDISLGQEAFLRTAKAIRIIHAEELFHPYQDFLDYCSSKWDMDRNMAYRFKKAGELLENLKDCEDKPQNEGQCRELVQLGGEVQKAVWLSVVSTAKESGQRITAALIKDAVSKYMGKDKDEPKSTTDTSTPTDTSADTTTLPSTSRELSSATPATAIIEAELTEMVPTVLDNQGHECEHVKDNLYRFTIAADSKADLLVELAHWAHLVDVRKFVVTFS